MKSLACAVLAVCALVMPVRGSENEMWITDFAKAKTLASEKNIPILVDFTGSDWCGWCMKLDKEVFSKTEFQEYAKENLILLKVDFPRKKLPEPQASANGELATKFKIEGYPTIVLGDAEGKELNRTGYKPGGPAAYVAHIQALLKK